MIPSVFKNVSPQRQHSYVPSQHRSRAYRRRSRLKTRMIIKNITEFFCGEANVVVVDMTMYRERGKTAKSRYTARQPLPLASVVCAPRVAHDLCCRVCFPASHACCAGVANCILVVFRHRTECRCFTTFCCLFLSGICLVCPVAASGWLL